MTLSRRRLVTAAAGAVALQGLDLALGLGTAGCGGQTSGEIVELDFAVRSDALAGAPFVNALGWSIELSRARVAIASLQLFELGQPSSTHARWRWPGLSVAQAHPGHVADAGVRAEMIQPAVVDLAEGPRPLGRGRGIAGQVGSGYLSFDPTALDGWALWLEGRADRDGASRDFVARTSTNALESWHGDPEIWGCPVDADAVTGDGRVELVVSPRLWLDEIDFTVLPDTDGPTELDPLSPASSDFVAAARSPQGWSFHVEPARGAPS